MSFFPPQPPDQSLPPTTEEDPPDPYDPAVGQIPGVLGIPVAVPSNVIRTEGLALAMDLFVVYREGFMATIRTTMRPGHSPQADLFAGLSGRPDLPPSERVLWGLEFSDGRRGYADGVEPGAAGSFGIFPRGGGGSTTAARFRSWVYAIPSPGPMTFVVSWEAGGLEESSVEIDASGIAAAAQQVESPWFE